MALTPVEFANGWREWKDQHQYADTDPQAYAAHLERVHALNVQEALKRLLESNLSWEAEQIEALAFSEYGDTWVESAYQPFAGVDGEWPDTPSEVADDPDSA